METFEIVPAYDERTRVPFRVPRKGQDPLEFTIPRLQYLTEEQATQMKEDLQALDKFVPQIDVNGDVIFKLERDGTYSLDDDGNKEPLMGPPQRTVAEKSRITATTMLAVVVDDETLNALKKLTVGELDQILSHWTSVSSKPLEGLDLGESSASSSS